MQGGSRLARIATSLSSTKSGLMKQRPNPFKTTHPTTTPGKPSGCRSIASYEYVFFFCRALFAHPPRDAIRTTIRPRFDSPGTSESCHPASQLSSFWLPCSGTTKARYCTYHGMSSPLLIRSSLLGCPRSLLPRVVARAKESPRAEPAWFGEFSVSCFVGGWVLALGFDPRE